MKKLILPLIFVLLASCSSYTISDGRKNISVPENINLPSTKLDDSDDESVVEASALFLFLQDGKIENIESVIESVHDIGADIIVLIGSEENQKLFRTSYTNIYELEGTTIILSDRPVGTTSMELYIDDVYAILAQTEFPVLSSD